MATLHREAVDAEGDLFDDAMVAAVTGLADMLRAEGDELEILRRRVVRRAAR